MWVAVPGFSRYEVSDDGRVRGPRGELRRFIDASGYYRLGLYRAGTRVNVRVHTLIAVAFIGPRPPGMVARHVNGDSLDNSPSNLRWGTQSENVRDSIAHGTQRNVRKTACPAGHPYDKSNTGYGVAGNRVCKTCRRDRERNRRALKRKTS